jgi:hypothetical protein
MNLKRILIEESEKNRILGMHSKHNSLITEAVTDFPACVRYAGKEVSIDEVADSMGISFADIQSMMIQKGFPLSGFPKNWIRVDWNGNVLLWGTTKFKYYVQLSGKGSTAKIKVSPYHCKCTNGKPKATLTTSPKEDETKCEQQKDSGNDGQKDSNCKNKTPYNAITDAGLNWKEESRKWIEAKCNGTTPCISGNASTNINLRNAFCDGTWGSKNGQDDGKQPEGCKTKCAAKPLQPGQTGQQVMGWFYSRDGVCYQDTGVGGFSSKAECEACKCGSSQQDGNNGNDSWSKYPCVLKRIKDNTLTKSKDFVICGCYQLTETCVIFSDGTAWCEGTSPGKGDLYYYQCFVDEIRIIKEKPIQVGIDRPNKPIKGGDELPDFIPPVIEKPIKSFD